MIPLCYCHSLEQTQPEPPSCTKFTVTIAQFSSINAQRGKCLLCLLLLPFFTFLFFVFCFFSSQLLLSLSFLTSPPSDSKLFGGSWAGFTQSCKELCAGLSSSITFVTSITQWQLLLLSCRPPCHSELVPATLLSALYLLKMTIAYLIFSSKVIISLFEWSNVLRNES